ALLEALGRVETELSASQAEPTETMPGTAHRSIAERREARQKRRRRTMLIGGISAAALIAIAIILILILGRGRKPPSEAVSPPRPPKPGTRNPQPAPAASRQEHNAQILFNNARVCAEREDWAKALAYLDRLDETYAETDFRADHEAAIAALREKIEAALKPAAAKPGEWQAAWAEADAKAKARVSEQRFGEAMSLYQELADRFDDTALKERAQKATMAVYDRARAAFDKARGRARELLAEENFDQARAALRPVIERFGVPGQTEKAEKLLAEIDAAEESDRAAAQAAAEEARKEAERARREAERKRRQQAEARFAEALKPIDQQIAAWQFKAAAEALARLDFDEERFGTRLATRRDEARRLAALKARLIERINTSKPPLRKSSLLIPGINGDLVKADAEGLTAKLPNGKTEDHPWQDLTGRSVERLIGYSIDEASAEDQLAAGILMLGVGDAGAAEEHFAQAKDRGAAIAPYLGPLAAASFAHAQALLEEKKFEPAAEAIAAIETRYAKTPWFAAHKQDVAEALAQARAALADAEAEKLYVRAAALFKKKDLWALKPLIAKLQADCPNATLLTDATRKPTFAEMAAAVAKLGKRLTVRKDGRGDFNSIQPGIHAAPPNSLIEIQDSALYNGRVGIGKGHRGLTIRGKYGSWPVVSCDEPKRTNDVLVNISARAVLLERIVIAYQRPWATMGLHFWGGGELQLESVIVAGAARMGSGGRLKASNSIWVGEINLCCPGTFMSCPWLGGVGTSHALKSLLVENCVCGGLSVAGSYDKCTIRRSTIAGRLFLARPSNRVVDCIVGGIEARSDETTITHCDVFRSQDPFLDQANPGKGCLSRDPQFRDPKKLDYRLKPTSPCRKRASDGGGIGCRYTKEMLEMLKLAHELRRKGIIKF
ncbi:MAG: hypothetical protein ACODAJ_04130, partial [Planctomycetota bacterium]